MLFNLFISKFNAIADNTPFLIKFSSDKSADICSVAKKSGITSVIKTTSLMAIKGVEYAKLNTTMDKVANGKVLANQLTWGHWSNQYKNIIEHTRKDGTFHQYVRLYFPEEKQLPKTIVATETMYLVNGTIEMTKQELIDKGYMVNSHWYPKEDNCFNVDIANVELIEA